MTASMAMATPDSVVDDVLRTRKLGLAFWVFTSSFLLASPSFSAQSSSAQSSAPSESSSGPTAPATPSALKIPELAHATGGAWTVAPALSIQETYTDNLRLA